MKAIILAAGEGKRLKKYANGLPKGMLIFMGQTLIERQIALYRDCGISDIIIVRGYAAEKINYNGVRYYEDFSNTNMIESLMAAKSEFDADAIISYSDILFEKRMLLQMQKSDANFSVAVDSNWEKYWHKRYGRIDYDTESLTLDESGNITELGQQNVSPNQMEARYIGLLKFSKAGLQYATELYENAIQNKVAFGRYSGDLVRMAYMTDLLNAVILSGKIVKAERFTGGWIEFDTNDDYENAIKWAKDGSIAEVISL